MTEKSVLKYFEELPIDVDTPDGAGADTDVLVDRPAAEVAGVMLEGSHVKLLCWKRSPDNRVLAYPGVIGTVTEMGKHAEGGTFVTVSIKPHWFSPRMVEVFPQDLELVPSGAQHTLPSTKKPTPSTTQPKPVEKFYSLGEMQVFEAFKENFYARYPGSSIGQAVSAIKLSMPTIFPKLKGSTAARFPQNIEKEKAELEAEKKKKKKKKKRKALHQGDSTQAPSMKEKEEQLAQELAERSAGKGGNRRILTPELFLSLGMLLYALFLSGCPLTSGTALPMMLGHIRAQGFGNILHSLCMNYMT